MAELAFEKLALALETTRGTAVTTPTHYFPLSGMINPQTDFFRPAESRGTLANFYRSAAVRKWADWSADGGADPRYLPVLLNMAVKAVASPSTPTNGVLTRLWTFAPTMTSDDIETATLVWGDPNVQIFQSEYAVANTFSINADASGTDAATMSIGGFAKFPDQVSAPTFPAQTIGSLLMPGSMQLWLDTSSAIGTTEITDGRVVSANFSVTNNISRKHLAAGVAGNLEFTRIGRGKRNAETQVVFELLDTDEYDIFEAGTDVKLRVRVNGDLIESVTPDYYNYVEWDIYGPLHSLSWAEHAGTNRTVGFTITSEYNATAGHDWQVQVQNASATL